MTKHNNLIAGLTAALSASAGEEAWGKVDVDIQHEGTKITLPADPGPMPIREAIKALERKAKDEETQLDVHEVLDAFPEDALVALNIAMRQKYGWASPTPQMSWFGPVAPDLPGTGGGASCPRDFFWLNSKKVAGGGLTYPRWVVRFYLSPLWWGLEMEHQDDQHVQRRLRPAQAPDRC